MAKLPSSFNSDNYDDIGEFEAIPVGEYEAKITQSDLVKTSAGTGEYLKLTFEIISGDYRGRLLWSNLNLVNPSDKSVEIAHKELATICRACGKLSIEESEELHGIPMIVKVRVKPATARYPASNAIANYKPLAGLARPSAPAQGGGVAQPTKPAEVKPPRPSQPLMQFDD